MMNLVAGKLSFVTGAGSGIGKEVCRILAREGATVIATDKNIKTAQDTVKTLKGNAHVAMSLQVSDRQNVEAVFNDIKKQYAKPPTIIINAAGVALSNPFLDLTDNNFDTVIDVNLKGTFLVMQSAVKAMIEANATEDSSIINISSISAKHCFSGHSNYSAAKAGVVALTKTASMEFGKLGVRVNALLPGYIATPMSAGVPDSIKEMMVEKIPSKRIGKPEEVAEVIVFLSSDRSSYVNGASIEVTGGMN